MSSTRSQRKVSGPRKPISSWPGDALPRSSQAGARNGREESLSSIQTSSGNVFQDLGFPDQEAENLRLRAELMIALTRLIDTRGLTQARAAKLFGVTQPRVSDLVRGKIHLFSIDTLVSMLGRAGIRLSVVLRPGKRVA
jgi:predicted XRE-type DNA-binding protein